MSDAKAIEPADEIAELKDEIESLNYEILTLRLDAKESAADFSADFAAFCADLIAHYGPLPLALRLRAEDIATALGVALPPAPRRP